MRFTSSLCLMSFSGNPLVFKARTAGVHCWLRTFWSSWDDRVLLLPLNYVNLLLQMTPR
jgi:hypothetical protein